MFSDAFVRFMSHQRVLESMGYVSAVTAEVAGSSPVVAAVHSKKTYEMNGLTSIGAKRCNPIARAGIAERGREHSITR